MNYIVTMFNDWIASVPGYRAAAEEGGVLSVATADGNALFAPRTWKSCIPEGLEVEWTEPPQPQPAGDQEKPFNLPFAVVPRGDVIAQRLSELDD